MKVESMSSDDIKEEVLSAMMRGQSLFYIAVSPLTNEEWQAFVADLGDSGIASVVINLEEIPTGHREGVAILRKHYPECWIIRLDASEAQAALRDCKIAAKEATK